MTKLRSLLTLPLIALLALSLSACGGDDEAADLDPTAVLEQTFSGDHEVNSGVLEITASGEVPGGQGGSGSLAIMAPFNNNGSGEVPDAELTIDLEGEAQGESLDLTAGGTLTPEGATINFNDDDYAVPAELFEQLADGLVQGLSESSDEGGALSLEDFGIDPLTWFTNVTNEGTEDIDGTDTVHISGDADIVAIGQDIFAAVEDLGIPGAELPEGFDPAQLSLLESFFEEASFDVYSEADGNLLRRLEATIKIANLGALGGGESSDSISFELSVTLNEPNEQQEIELPTETRPIDELEQALRDEFGEGFDFGGELGLPGQIKPGDLDLDLGGGKKSGKPDLPGVTQDYLRCLKDAKNDSPEAIAKCAEEFE